MKNFKKLLFIAVATMPAAVLGDCCGTGVGTGCNTGCCGTDTTASCDGGHVTNKSVYVDIGPWQSGAYLHENFFRNNRMALVEDGWGSAFQAVFFGGRTTDDGQNGLGRRFGLNHKRCMVVASNIDEINNPALNVSIDSSHFNILTEEDTFRSTICLCPRQTYGGVLLSWKQAFWCREDNTARWWFEFNLPVVHVNNNMNLKEEVANAGGGVDLVGGVAATGLDGAPVVADMTAAFKQSNWKYGKINGCRENTELANGEFKVGYDYVRGGCCHLGSYIGLAFKTTACRTAEYVFEAVVGQEHYALMWGSNFDIAICQWENSELYAHFAMDSRWWFEGSERRSFDLLGKGWSRYQAMYKHLDEARAALAADAGLSGTSGINLMTRDVCVTPGYQILGTMAFEYKGCRFNAELGHTFYARMAEKVLPNWVDGPVLKAFQGAGFVNRFRTIKDPIACADEVVSATDSVVYDRNVIHKCDVDWNSGAHEAILAHTFYGAIGYNMDDWCYPSFISIGGAYDFDAEDDGTSVQRRWTIFGKIGVSF